MLGVLWASVAMQIYDCRPVVQCRFFRLSRILSIAQPAHYPSFLELTKEHIGLRLRESKLLGYWECEIGALNQVCRDTMLLFFMEFVAFDFYI